MRLSNRFFFLHFSSLMTNVYNYLEGTAYYIKLKETVNSEIDIIFICLNAHKLTSHIKTNHFMLIHRSRIENTKLDIIMQSTAVNCVLSSKTCMCFKIYYRLTI